jgi:hypothetical protein
MDANEQARRSQERAHEMQERMRKEQERMRTQMRTAEKIGLKATQDAFTTQQKFLKRSHDRSKEFQAGLRRGPGPSPSSGGGFSALPDAPGSSEEGAPGVLGNAVQLLILLAFLGIVGFIALSAIGVIGR